MLFIPSNERGIITKINQQCEKMLMQSKRNMRNIVNLINTILNTKGTKKRNPIKIISLIIVVIVSSLFTYYPQVIKGESKQMTYKNDDNRNNHNNRNNKTDNYQHTKYTNYNKALYLLWTEVYKNHGKTIYCNKPFSTASKEEKSKAHVNAEHIFPMSWVTKQLKCGTRQECRKNSKQFKVIESDLHNIYPASERLNEARSNYQFGTIKGEKRIFGNGCDFEVDDNRRIAEPTNRKRGDIARAMLYLAHTYNLNLPKKTRQLMQQWDTQDKPDAEEKRREKIIRNLQGRENKFITQHPYRP